MPKSLLQNNLGRRLFVLALFVGILTRPDLVRADTDTTPPQLVSFDFSPQTVNTSATSQMITFTARITDAPAGVQSANGRLFSQSGFQNLRLDFNRVSGTAQDGTFVSSVTGPAFSEAGTWRI